MVGRFERAFASALGVKHCIATPGCTPALHLLAMALDLQPGDEVVVSPITDYGTIMGLIKERLIPVFADTVPGTVNISAETIAPLHHRPHPGHPGGAQDGDAVRHGPHRGAGPGATTWW